MDRELSNDEAPLEKSCWVVDMEKEAMSAEYSDSERAQWSKHSIYRVPAYIKDLNRKVYEPQIISFGPFHHGKQQLAPMEEHKRRSLRHFLRRCRRTTGNKSLQDCVVIFKGVVGELMAAYQGLDEKWKKNPERFIEIMILDGCFMLEIMQLALHKHHMNDYASNDPVFRPLGVLTVVPYIIYDMLMIENQLPLRVLHMLYVIENGKTPGMENDRYINSLVCEFFELNLPLPSDMPLRLHPLDVYRTFWVHQSPTSERRDAQVPNLTSKYIRSVTELHEAGIRFKKSDTNSPRDIVFVNGKLQLPMIVVDDATEYLFLNLLAFERLHADVGNEVTAYVFFLDSIIDHPRDVSFLKSKGIIKNLLGSDEAVAKLFNSLGNNVAVFANSYLERLNRMVNAYCEKSWRAKWNSWTVNLMTKYFQSPWSVISLIAAIFLLAMTGVQTFYSVYSAYNKK